MPTFDLNSLRDEAAAMRDQLIAVRRDLHAHPELAFQEVRTAGIVADKLSQLGYEVQTGIGKTGVVGLIEGSKRGKPADQPLTLLLRFDMDALPIDEQVDAPFKSQSANTMHACGHDAHTSIGLAVAEMMAKHRDQWAGVAKFVFQPAEEIARGARAMIDDGVLESPRPDRALSVHVWTPVESGSIVMTDGPQMAGSQSYTIKVRGRGAHGASPQQGADPVVASAHIITALQTIVSRNVDPLESGVVTVGSIHGGIAHNIIPDEVLMLGTIRAFKEEVLALLVKRIHEIVAGVATSLGVSAEVIFAGDNTPPVSNDPAMAAIVREVAGELVGADKVHNGYRTMGAEDAAFFLKAAPGAYVFVGAGNKAKDMTEPHHSPRFQIDEDCMPLAVTLLTASAIKMLE
jgi:amidohydrolase